jgi:hypothetical protein
LKNTRITKKNEWSQERDVCYCYYSTAQKYPIKKFASE